MQRPQAVGPGVGAAHVGQRWPSARHKLSKQALHSPDSEAEAAQSKHACGKAMRSRALALVISASRFQGLRTVVKAINAPVL